MNDIVIFSRTLKDHLKHLHVVFQLFSKKRVSISSKKSFIDYSSVILLDQKVDDFDLTISVEKLKTIISLDFSWTLHALNIYLNMIDWLRNYVSYYAQIVESLQRRKTELSVNLLKNNLNTYWSKINKRTFELIKLKVRFFQHFQNHFVREKVLTHFDSDRQLWVNLDAFKKINFIDMIYHVKDEKMIFTQLDVQFILFLSRTLNSAERNYWLTKLKVANLIWMIKKIHHMMKSTLKLLTIIYIDHAVAVIIVKQISLTTANTNKLNLHLIWISQYLFIFQLDIRHKVDKINIMLDALFRLLRDKLELKSMKETFKDDILNLLHERIIHKNQIIYVCITSLIELSLKFKSNLIEALKDDKRWKNILSIARKKITKSLNDQIVIQWSQESHFKVQKKLLYHVNENSKRHVWLVILKKLKHKMFLLTHSSHHADFHWIYQRIVKIMYVRKLTFRLWKFIDHCLKCQLYQIRRYQSYDEMISISSANTFFHTITLNFILTLSISIDELKCLLIIINKFFKRLMLISDKSIWSMKKWVYALIEKLQQANWNMSSAIIFNCNLKFLSDFWQATFEKLKILLLTSMIYHFQIDDQSEHSNQTVKITLWFLLFSINESLWSSLLISLQANFNNFMFVNTDKSFNEIVYDFKTINISSLINSEDCFNYTVKQSINVFEAADAITFAKIKMKAWYDYNHKSMILWIKDYAFLWLHHNYHLSDHSFKKLSQQYCNSFLIIKWVKKLAYELELSSHWRIHSIIFIVQLKSAFKNADSFKHSRSDNSFFIEVEKNINKWVSYEIKKLIDDRVQWFDRRSLIRKYLVRWKEYESEYNEWYDEDLLDNALELIWNYEVKRKLKSKKKKMSNITTDVISLKSTKKQLIVKLTRKQLKRLLKDMKRWWLDKIIEAFFNESMLLWIMSYKFVSLN